MPSELDLSFERHIATFTAPGAILETTTVERGGQAYPAFAKAPPSLTHYMAHYCHEHGDAIFLVDGETRISFAQAFAIASKIARGLVSKHGVLPGDRVGLAARNSANWVLAHMAIVLAGGCATLLNGWWTEHELAEGIELAGCKLVLADPRRTQRLEGRESAAEIVTFSNGGNPRAAFARLLSADDDTALPELRPESLATILFTSGSTGKAKGVVSDHQAIVNACLNFAAQTLMVLTQMKADGEEPKNPPCALVPIPLFHVTGEVPLYLQSFILGRRLVMMPKWDPVEAMRLIEAEKITYFIGVPLMSHEIAAHPERELFDLSSCVTFGSGGAPRPPSHVETIRSELPTAYPIIGYGLTETNAVGCGNFNRNYLAKPASTGRPGAPLAQVGIFDEAGQQLPTGQTGEIAIRSICNMLGYWHDEEATKAAFTKDGWFLTGDLGYLDEDNYLFIVDRKKDIIIRGGENIACTELEQAIYDHPDVIECSVFGVPDDRLGEVPAAVYRTRDGAELPAKELAEFLAETLAAYKIPEKMWRETAPLPRSGTEKIDRRALRERFIPLS